MTLSSVDPGAALVVVDLQQGTLANPRLIEPERVVGNAERLVAAFRAAGRPVVFVVFDPELTPRGRTELGGRRPVPSGFLDPLPTLVPGPEDARLVKGGWSAFSAPGLAPMLASGDVTQVVLTGVATTFGVESSARDAYDAGFDVVVVTDAVTDMSEETQRHAVTRVFPVLGETATTDDVLAALAG